LRQKVTKWQGPPPKGMDPRGRTTSFGARKVKKDKTHEQKIVKIKPEKTRP